MEQKTLGTILKAVGIAIGVVTAIIAIKLHPIIGGLLILGAGVYFIGDYLA
jgi:hypothetical protein